MPPDYDDDQSRQAAGPTQIKRAQLTSAATPGKKKQCSGREVRKERILFIFLIFLIEYFNNKRV
jgi:hypothetical protein